MNRDTSESRLKFKLIKSNHNSMHDVSMEKM